MSDVLTEVDLEGRGFGLAPLLTRETVEQLKERFFAIGLRDDHEFYSSNNHSSRRDARAIDQFLKATVGPHLQRLLPDHEPFLGAYISKGAGTGSEVEFHRDWTYTDERTLRAIAVWIPLVDVDDSNGVLRLVPESHREPDAVQLRVSGVGNLLRPRQEELRRRSVGTQLEAGTAVVYDPAVAHGSEPNRTDEVRPAVAIALAPRGADLFHFHLDPWGALRGFRVDEAYFTMQTFAGCPQGYEPVSPWTTAALPPGHRPGRRPSPWSIGFRRSRLGGQEGAGTSRSTR